MKKISIVLILFIILNFLGCESKDDKKTTDVLGKQVKVSESQNTKSNQNEVDIKTSNDEIDLRKLFKVDNK